MDRIIFTVVGDIYIKDGLFAAEKAGVGAYMYITKLPAMNTWFISRKDINNDVWWRAIDEKIVPPEFKAKLLLLT